MVILIVATHIAAMGDTSAVKYQKSSKCFDWPLDGVPFLQALTIPGNYIHEADIFKLHDIINPAF